MYLLRILQKMYTAASVYCSWRELAFWVMDTVSSIWTVLETTLIQASEKYSVTLLPCLIDDWVPLVLGSESFATGILSRVFIRLILLHFMSMVTLPHHQHEC